MKLRGNFFFSWTRRSAAFYLQTEGSNSVYFCSYSETAIKMSRFGAKKGRKLPGAEFSWDTDAANGESEPTLLQPVR